MQNKISFEPGFRSPDSDEIAINIYVNGLYSGFTGYGISFRSALKNARLKLRFLGNNLGCKRLIYNCIISPDGR